SAFDILEDFVNRELATEQNRVAVESDILTSVMEPRTVDVTTVLELLNAPKLDEDELSNFDLSELPKNEVLTLTNEFDDSEFVDIVEEADEAIELAEALDEAFDKLMNAAKDDNFDLTMFDEVEQEESEMSDEFIEFEK